MFLYQEVKFPCLDGEEVTKKSDPVAPEKVETEVAEEAPLPKPSGRTRPQKK